MDHWVPSYHKHVSNELDQETCVRRRKRLAPFEQEFLCSHG
jgi:hypothetical protein